MNTGLTSLQDQVNRLFEDNFTRDRSGPANLATWAPPVEIYETENDLVVKADLPDFRDKDIDVRVENNSTVSSENIRAEYHNGVLRSVRSRSRSR